VSPISLPVRLFSIKFAKAVRKTSDVDEFKEKRDKFLEFLEQAEKIDEEVNKEQAQELEIKLDETVNAAESVSEAYSNATIKANA